MKIGLDLRFIGDNIYSTFVLELVIGIIEKSSGQTFVIYTNKKIEGLEHENVTIKNVGIKNGSIQEQSKYLKILKHDNNNLMIFFNHFKPILYTLNYFTLLPSLKDVYYSNFSNYIKKYSYLYLLEKNLNNSVKIICFDTNTSDELIEKYNISERKINLLQGFFPNIHIHDHKTDLKINIKTRYGIKNDFFIYSGGEGVEKNYEKLVYVFDKLKKDGHQIDLVFLGEAISKNVILRNIIINLDLQTNIHFIGHIKQSEKIMFYNESMGVLFPSFYEPFPFRLSEPLHFGTAIISSELKNIRSIFGESINYFSAISVNNIYEKVKSYIDDKEGTKFHHKPVFEKIKKKYSKENSIKQLIEIID
ncbi:MAG: glycosyltransferase [Candidatus Gracilibacteria bacterium]|nr:glycosyltransferase [Candidatus Gracilibacteria bacterium]